MALRVKEVTIGERTFRIGNALVGPWRRYMDALARAQTGAIDGELLDAQEAFVLCSLQRAGPGVTVESLRELDGDDYKALGLEAMRWFNQRPEEPMAGETGSP